MASKSASKALRMSIALLGYVSAPARCRRCEIHCRDLQPRDARVYSRGGEECPGVFQELAEGWLVLEEEVVAPLQGHELDARNTGCHAAPGFERDAGIVACVQYERRHAQLREQCGDIELTACLVHSGGH